MKTTGNQGINSTPSSTTESIPTEDTNQEPSTVTHNSRTIKKDTPDNEEKKLLEQSRLPDSSRPSSRNIKKEEEKTSSTKQSKITRPSSSKTQVKNNPSAKKPWGSNNAQRSKMPRPIPRETTTSQALAEKETSHKSKLRPSSRNIKKEEEKPSSTKQSKITRPSSSKTQVKSNPSAKKPWGSNNAQRSKIPRATTTSQALAGNKGVTKKKVEVNPSVAHAEKLTFQESTKSQNTENTNSSKEVTKIKSELLNKLDVIFKKNAPKTNQKELSELKEQTRKAIDEMSKATGLSKTIQISKAFEDQLKSRSPLHKSCLSLITSEKMQIGYLRQIHNIKASYKGKSKNLELLENAATEVVKSSLKSATMKALNDARVKFLTELTKVKPTKAEKETIDFFNDLAKSVDTYQGKKRCAINIQQAFSKDLISKENKTNDELNNSQKIHKTLHIVDLLVNGRIGEDETQKEGEKFYKPVITTNEANKKWFLKKHKKKPLKLSVTEKLHQDDAVFVKTTTTKFIGETPVRDKNTFKQFGIHTDGSALAGSLETLGVGNNEILKIFQKLERLIEKEQPPRHSHFTHAVRAIAKNKERDQEELNSEEDEEKILPNDVHNEMEADAAKHLKPIIVPTQQALTIKAEDNTNTPAESEDDSEQLSDTISIADSGIDSEALEDNATTEVSDSSDEDEEIVFIRAIEKEKIIPGQEQTYTPLDVRPGNKPSNLAFKHNLNISNSNELLQSCFQQLSGQDLILFRKYAAYAGDSGIKKGKESSINTLMASDTQQELSTLDAVKQVFRDKSDLSTPSEFFKALSTEKQIGGGFYRSTVLDKDKNEINKNLLPIAFELVHLMREEGIDSIQFLHSEGKITEDSATEFALKDRNVSDFKESFRALFPIEKNDTEAEKQEKHQHNREHYKKISEAIKKSHPTKVVTELANRVTNTIISQARHDNSTLTLTSEDISTLTEKAKTALVAFESKQITPKYLAYQNREAKDMGIAPPYSIDDISEFQALQKDSQQTADHRQKMLDIVIKPFTTAMLYLAYDDISKLVNPVAKTIEGSLKGSLEGGLLKTTKLSTRDLQTCREKQALLSAASVQTANLSRLHLK